MQDTRSLTKAIMAFNYKMNIEATMDGFVLTVRKDQYSKTWLDESLEKVLESALHELETIKSDNDERLSKRKAYSEFKPTELKTIKANLINRITEMEEKIKVYSNMIAAHPYPQYKYSSFDTEPSVPELHNNISYCRKQIFEMRQALQAMSKY